MTTPPRARAALPFLAAAVALAACSEGSPTFNPPPNVPPPNPGDTLPVDTLGLRIAELRSLWDSLAPDYDGEAFTTAPSFAGAPYDAGVLDPEFVQDGLDLMNFVRAAARLPADLRVDDQLQTRAQHAATLLARLQTLTRQPTRPGDMEDDFFSLAVQGINVSNLAAGTSVNALEDAVSRWIDGDPTSELLNRRWLLNPRMAVTGFGFADGYAAVPVLDVSRNPAVPYDIIGWPGPRAFPVEFFADDDYWTLSLNPVWDPIQPDDVTITVTRESDDAEWSLTSQDGGGGPDGEYFEVADIATGTGPALIFRPGSGFTAAVDETYVIRVEGLDRLGAPTVLTYAVTFFSLEG